MQCRINDTVNHPVSVDMVLLDGEIDWLNGQFPNVMDSTSFPDKWKEVRERLEVLNKEIIVKKQGKFVQDKLAFSEGYAYKWTGRQHPRRNTVRNRRPQETTIVTDLTESNSSIS